MPQKPPRPSAGTTPAEPVSRKDPAQAPDPVHKAEAAAPAERVQQAAPVGPAEAAAPVSPAARSELVGAIARRLRAGDITTQQAVEELIEDAVHTNLGPEGGDSPLSEKLRAALRAYVEQDPFLASRVKGLERKR